MFTSLTAVLVAAASVSGATAAADTRGRGAWMLDPSEDAVLLVTPRAGVERFDGCRWPSQLTVASSGVAYVSCRQSGEVRRLVQGEPATPWAVGTEPAALALDEAAGRLYVGLTSENAVVMLDAETGQQLARAELGVEPTALALFPAGLAVGSRKSDVVRVYARSLEGSPAERRIRVGQIDPSIAVTAGVEAFAPEGQRLIIVAPVAEVGNITAATYYGGTRGSPVTQELFSLSADLELKRLRSVVLPDVAAVYVEKGAVKLASRGLGGIVSMPLAGGPVTMDWDVPAGTIGVARAGDRTFVLNDVAREIRVATYARPGGSRAPRRVEPIALGGGGDPELARGRALFHTANSIRISSAPLACASCHRDGRDDGRTWLGQLSKRQTPMLAGRDIAHTAPYGWSGQYETLEQYINFTIQDRMLGDGLGKKDLAALARYVREGLRPVARPAITVARRDDVRRGRIVFHDGAVGCATCHGAMESFTDGQRHDVWPWQPAIAPLTIATLIGTAPPQNPFQDLTTYIQQQADRRLGIVRPPTPPPKLPPPPPPPRYDTPSLKQLALTAPYLHDGSAKTLDAVFTRLGDHMGTVSALTTRERADLVAYLSTL